MHDHRNEAAERSPRRANTPPDLCGVRGFGYVDYVSVELHAVQVAWLIDEIDTLRETVDEELARQLADEGNDVSRLTYKLTVLSMIREQLPAGEVERGADTPTVVGPAEVMTALVHGAAINTADALGEALRRRAAQPEVSSRLRTLADAAQAFARTFAELRLVQGYRFDPDYQPIGLAELE